MSESKPNPAPEKIVRTVCHSHCGGSCPVRVHVADGRITRIEGDDSEPEYRACARGRAYRQRVYAADRVLYPMRRTGARGSGEFERISWDQALDTVATEINRVKTDFGPEALLYLASVGDVAWVHTPGLMERLFARAGGYSGPWGMASGEGAVFASLATYGIPSTGNMREDFLNSRLIIMWGWNPAVASNFANTRDYIARAKAAGTRGVVVDPRFTDSAAVYADEWLPIRPGTDTAMLVAMAQVIFIEGLADEAFVTRYTLGMDEYQEYVLGASDGVPKTPQRAEAITGVPAARITALARDYATLRPAALMDGFAPGRSAYGEQFHRAAMALASLTANLGIPGGSAPGCACLGDQLPAMRLGPHAWMMLPPAANLVDDAYPPRPESPFYRGMPVNYYGGGPSGARVNRFKIADAILRGKRGGYPADYKLAYIVNFNYVNQYANSNKIAEALTALDFVVVQEQYFTATARYADILLPVNTFMERNDITNGGLAPFVGYTKQAIDSEGESKSQLEIAAALAGRLGIEDFLHTDEERWIEEIMAKCPEVEDYAEFKRDGIKKVVFEKPYVCFRNQISDPDNHPFPTPSGKIEIYSAQLAAMSDPNLPPIPKYIPPWEGPDDPLTAKFPLQLVTTHTLRRAHTQFDNAPWLRELYRQSVYLNPADAGARDIRDGDMVRVFNERGVIQVPVAVTERVMPGVVDVPQGSWYRPDAEGVDHGGCANTLTMDTPSPAGAFCSNTALVELIKA